MSVPWSASHAPRWSRPGSRSRAASARIASSSADLAPAPGRAAVGDRRSRRSPGRVRAPVPPDDGGGVGRFVVVLRGRAAALRAGRVERLGRQGRERASRHEVAGAIEVDEVVALVHPGRLEDVGHVAEVGMRQDPGEARVRR